MAVYVLDNPYKATTSALNESTKPGDDHHLESDLNPKFDTSNMWKHTQYKLIPGHEDEGPQPFLQYNGHQFRVRSEMMIFNGKGEILTMINTGYKRGGNTIECCGGGLERNQTPLSNAIKETQEEGLITIKEGYYTNIFYWYEVPDSEKEEWKCWGHISYICCGMYGGKYTGYVPDKDKDSFADKAKWYKPEELNLPNAHEEARRQYIQWLSRNGVSGKEAVNESLLRSIMASYHKPQ